MSGKVDGTLAKWASIEFRPGSFLFHLETIKLVPYSKFMNALFMPHHDFDRDGVYMVLNNMFLNNIFSQGVV